MRRRKVLLGLGATVAWPRAARAQQGGRVRRIGCLVSGSPESHGQFVAAFRQRLEELGYREGRDITLELRWAEGRVERLPGLAAELASLKPEVVVTAIAAAAVAAKQAMPTVPVVSATLADPVGLGLVASYARPGGTVTGILFSLDTLLGKQLELAREMKPGTSRIGMLVNMRNPSNVAQRRDAEATAPALGIELAALDVRGPEDLEAALGTLTRAGSEFLLVPGDSIFVTERGRLAALATAAGLPMMAGLRDFAEAGGLVSYGIDLRENWRRAAYFGDRILKGADPADLPVELPAKYELVLNLKTAKALGLAILPTLLARADEVIE
jgi:putative tryptophan/tyrosine transport system substrate-binding protein